MSFYYNELTTKGVEYGPWKPINIGVYALSGVDIEIDGRDVELERDHQSDMTVAAIEEAWDQNRITSEEADFRLNALI